MPKSDHDYLISLGYVVESSPLGGFEVVEAGIVKFWGDVNALQQWASSLRKQELQGHTYFI